MPGEISVDLGVWKDLGSGVQGIYIYLLHNTREERMTSLHCTAVFLATTTSVAAGQTMGVCI